MSSFAIETRTTMRLPLVMEFFQNCPLNSCEFVFVIIVAAVTVSWSAAVVAADFVVVAPYQLSCCNPIASEIRKFTSIIINYRINALQIQIPVDGVCDCHSANRPLCNSHHCIVERNCYLLRSL